MNTNHDPFEDDLRALQRRTLPAEWRAEMLHAAATAPQAPRAPRTPRWLLAGWSLAWAATVVMYFTMPAEPSAPQAMGTNNNTAPPLLWQQRAAAIDALLAAN